MIMLLIISVISAFLILQGVTFWHNKNIGKAVLYVASALFGLSMMITGMTIATLNAQNPQINVPQQTEEQLQQFGR